MREMKQHGIPPHIQDFKLFRVCPLLPILFFLYYFFCLLTSFHLSCFFLFAVVSFADVFLQKVTEKEFPELYNEIGQLCDWSFPQSQYLTRMW